MERKAMATSALLFAVATFILWGTTNFLIGYGEKSLKIDPQVFTAMMWTAMGVLGAGMLAYVLISGKEFPIGFNLSVPVAAGLCLGIGILSFSFAMSHADMSTGATAAVATSNAVFTAILALVFLKEDLAIKDWVGIATVLAGVVLLRI